MNIFEAVLWLTLNVYHEARGECDLGQMAVAHVTMNRSRQKNLTIKDTVLAPGQFSWTEDDLDDLPHNWPAFFHCMKNVLYAAQGHDFTQGATYYHEKSIKPYWADYYVMTAAIENHLFYKD